MGNPVHAFHGEVDRSPLEMIDKDLEDDSHPMAPGMIPIGCLREVFSKCEFSARWAIFCLYTVRHIQNQ